MACLVAEGGIVRSSGGVNPERDIFPGQHFVTERLVNHVPPPYPGCGSDKVAQAPGRTHSRSTSQPTSTPAAQEASKGEPIFSRGPVKAERFNRSAEDDPAAAVDEDLRRPRVGSIAEPGVRH